MAFTLSVIIPAHNSEAYISRCLNSLRDALAAASGLRAQIIVVDDGSSDQTREIVLSQAEIDNRIVYCHQSNLGAAAARNTGFARADGKWIIFVDADDYVLPQTFSVLAHSIADASDETDMIAFDYIQQSGENQLEYRKNTNSERNLFSRTDIPALERLCICNIDLDGTPKTGLFGSLWAKAYRTAFIHKIFSFSGEFLPEGIERSEDILFTVRAIAQARVISYQHDAFYVYCFHPSSSTHRILTEERYQHDAVAYITRLAQELEEPTLSKYDFRQCLWQVCFTYLYEDSLRNGSSASAVASSARSLIVKSDIFSQAIDHLSSSMLSPFGRLRLFLIRRRFWYLYGCVIVAVRRIRYRQSFQER